MIRTVSIALLLVVMLAGSASAECAWVLWGQDRQYQYHPMGDAHKSLENCQDRADRLTQLDTKTTFTYTCLPDTVDPRGPKGR